MTLIVLCGLPNAGKTTYSKNYDNVIHIDDIRFTEYDQLMVELSERINNAFNANDTVVLDGICCSNSMRKRILSLFDDSIYKKCIFIDISEEDMLKREDRNRHKFELFAISHFFQKPTLDEGWDEIVTIN